MKYKNKWKCFWCKKEVPRGHELKKLEKHLERCRKKNANESRNVPTGA